MGKQFEIGKHYRVADLSKGDGDLKDAIERGFLSFPASFTCHSRGAGNQNNLEAGVAYSHTEGVINTSYEEEGDIPCAYDEDLEAGVFEEITEE
jgi:hypothetical protein